MDYRENEYQPIQYDHLRLAAVSYLPVVGWTLPLLLKINNKFTLHHVKQGFLAAVLFTFTSVFLNILNLFMISEWREVRLGLVVCIYTVYLLYLISAAISARSAFSGKEFNFPIIGRFAKKIDL